MNDSQGAPEGKRRANSQDHLQASRERLCRHLEVVTHLQRSPQVRAVKALLQECEGLKMLFPLLEELPDRWDYLARMQIQNLPDQLARLEIETQVLRYACQCYRGGRIVHALLTGGLIGGLLSWLCLSIAWLVGLGLSVSPDSDLLFLTALLCVAVVAGAITMAVLVRRSVEGHSELAIRSLLERQMRVKREGQAFVGHLTDVQAALFRKED